MDEVNESLLRKSMASKASNGSFSSQNNSVKSDLSSKRKERLVTVRDKKSKKKICELAIGFMKEPLDFELSEDDWRSLERDLKAIVNRLKNGDYESKLVDSEIIQKKEEVAFDTEVGWNSQVKKSSSSKGKTETSSEDTWHQSISTQTKGSLTQNPEASHESQKSCGPLTATMKSSLLTSWKDKLVGFERILEEITEDIVIIKSLGGNLKRPIISKQRPFEDLNTVLKKGKISMTLEHNPETLELEIKFKDKTKIECKLKNAEKYHLASRIAEILADDDEEAKETGESLELREGERDSFFSDLHSTVQSEQINPYPSGMIRQNFEREQSSRAKEKEKLKNREREITKLFGGVPDGKGENDKWKYDPKKDEDITELVVKKYSSYEIILFPEANKYKLKMAPKETFKKFIFGDLDQKPSLVPTSILNEYFQKCFNVNIVPDYFKEGKEMKISAVQKVIMIIRSTSPEFLKKNLQKVGALELMQMLAPPLYKKMVEFQSS